MHSSNSAANAMPKTPITICTEGTLKVPGWASSGPKIPPSSVWRYDRRSPPHRSGGRDRSRSPRRRPDPRDEREYRSNGVDRDREKDRDRDQVDRDRDTRDPKGQETT
ncbi:hypothetical protein JVT61DRAFT_14634 [Boletus reticuloceps]|uniref:Uncharacterized protein n=1 Tax=Boletus reticuloceps TaxID=495285 RepID=A0A8I3ABY2_9AGAM|nr:hypothetical protein JVT61DRAFT_14634 [Boletus reticuloceps]